MRKEQETMIYRPVGDEEATQMTKMWQSGMTYADIERETGRAHNVVARAIQRVVRREAARGVILTQANVVRVCPYCGREFEIPPSRQQKYCCEEHMRIANGYRAAERGTEKAREKKPREKKPRVVITKAVKDYSKMRDGRTPTLAEVAIKTDTQRAKWGAIAKKCEELGLSYGEARARGLL